MLRRPPGPAQRVWLEPAGASAKTQQPGCQPGPGRGPPAIATLAGGCHSAVTGDPSENSTYRTTSAAVTGSCMPVVKPQAKTGHIIASSFHKSTCLIAPLIGLNRSHKTSARGDPSESQTVACSPTTCAQGGKFLRHVPAQQLPGRILM